MERKVSKKLKDSLKKKLESEEKKLVSRIEQLKKGDPFSNPDHASDNAAVDTDAREKVGHETIKAQVLSLTKKLVRVKNALLKITKGKYGVCERCNKNISLARLKILPEAHYCVKCGKRLIK